MDDAGWRVFFIVEDRSAKRDNTYKYSYSYSTRVQLTTYRTFIQPHAPQQRLGQVRYEL